MRLILSLLTLTALMLPGAALADRERRGELQQTRAELFGATDQDGDGALDFDEFVDFTRLMHETQVRHRFERIDGNSDGLVTLEELDEAPRRRYRH